MNPQGSVRVRSKSLKGLQGEAVAVAGAMRGARRESLVCSAKSGRPLQHQEPAMFRGASDHGINLADKLAENKGRLEQRREKFKGVVRRVRTISHPQIRRKENVAAQDLALA